MKKIPTYKSDTAEIGLEPKNVPAHEMDRLVSPLIGIIAAYFDDPKIQEEFEIWKADRAAKAVPQKGGGSHACETSTAHP